MKYTQSQRLAIGQEIYEKKLNKEAAAVKYGINVYTARDYLRMYKASIGTAAEKESATRSLDYEKMTKRELIDLIMKLTK